MHKDYEEQLKISFPKEFNRQKEYDLNFRRMKIAQALDKLNQVNPKIFDTREIKTRLQQAKEELNKL